MTHFSYTLPILNFSTLFKKIGATKVPSTAFCLLVRLFTLRCTEKQMSLMLSHPDSPYIRCIGFLYLRYASDPSSLFSWFEPYLYDDEPLIVTANKKKINSHHNESNETTIGKYVRSLLMEMDYYGTLLPRPPVQIEREIKMRILQAEKNEARALNHLKNPKLMQYFQTPGAAIGQPIKALYADEENPVAWYDGVVDRVILQDDETGERLSRPKFIVTFPEYGNTETVSLGEIDMPIDQHTQKSNNSDRRDYRYEDSSRSSMSRSSHDDNYFDRHSSSSNRKSYDYNNNRDSYRNDGRRYNRDNHRNDDHNRNYRNDDDFAWRNNGRSQSSRTDNNKDNKNDRGYEEDLMQEVLRRERDKSSTSSNKKTFYQRPATFKESVAVRQDGQFSSSSSSIENNRGAGGGNRRRDEHYGSNRGYYNSQDYAPPPGVVAPVEKNASQVVQTGGSNSTYNDGSSRQETTIKRSAEEIAAVKEKKRKLLEKYG